MSITETFWISADTRIQQNAATTNAGSALSITIGEANDASSAIRRSLIFTDLSIIPAGSIIHSATLTMHFINANLANNNRTFDVFRVIRNWVEMEATWNIARTGVSWGTAGCGSTTTDFVNTSIGSFACTTGMAVGLKDIPLSTSEISAIVNRTVTYEGFILRMRTETDDAYIWASREDTTPERRPRIVINYTPPGSEFQVVII